MTTRRAEEVILDRFREKCRSAGGPRAGYVLRRAAILYAGRQHPDLDLEAGLGALVDQGLLKASDGGRFFFLTEKAVEQLGGESG